MQHRRGRPHPVVHRVWIAAHRLGEQVNHGPRPLSVRPGRRRILAGRPSRSSGAAARRLPRFSPLARNLRGKGGRTVTGNGNTFGHTLQTTHVWIKDLAGRLSWEDEHAAY